MVVLFFSNLVLLSLVGCTYIQDKDDSLDYQAKTCKTIKRQMTFNKNNLNQDAKWQAPSQRARLRQLYLENDCKSIKA